MADKAKSKYGAYKSDLTVLFSSAENPLINLTFKADLIPAKDTAENIKYESVCPDCHKAAPTADASKVSVQYVCPVKGHGPFVSADVIKATKVGKSLRVVATTEEVVEARQATVEEDDPTKENLVLRPYHALELERTTYPIGTTYVLTPFGKDKVFPLFLASIGHDGRVIGTEDEPVTLIGEVTLRNNRKLFQVRRWGEQLVLQELARPDDVKSEFDVHEVEATPKAVEGLVGYLAGEAIAFEPAEFGNQQKALMRAFTEARLEGGPNAQIIAMPQRPSVTANDDDALLSMLEASVADAPKKATRKKAS